MYDCQHLKFATENVFKQASFWNIFYQHIYKNEMPMHSITEMKFETRCPLATLLRGATLLDQEVIPSNISIICLSKVIIDAVTTETI